MEIKDLFALTRTTRNGKTGLGFGVILIVLVLMIGGGLYALKVKRTVQTADPKVRIRTTASDPVRRGGNPVVQPLIRAEDIQDKRPTRATSLEDAYRNAPPPKTNSLIDDIIPKVHPGQMPPDLNESHLVSTSLIVNRDNGTNAAVVAPGQPVEEKYLYAEKLLVIQEDTVAAQKKTGFELHKFLPRGHKVPVILLSKINTAAGSTLVEMAVARDVVFNGRLQLPFGWHLMGTPSRGPSHRVNVMVNTIIDPIGQEYPISGQVVNLSLEPGFDGYPAESPFMLQLLPLAQQTMSVFMGAAKDVVTQPTMLGTAFGTNMISEQQTYSLTAKNQLLDGTAKVLEGILDRKVQELNTLYPEGDIVPRGTLGYVLLASPLDLTLGKIGGSQDFLKPDERNPQPNIITMGQQQQYTPMNNLGLAGVQGMGGGQNPALQGMINQMNGLSQSGQAYAPVNPATLNMAPATIPTTKPLQ